MRSDRGTATVLMLALCGLIATLGVATAAIGVLLQVREEVATAAEAAALAAAVATYPPAAGISPRAVAADFASRNGARLVRCDCPVDGSLRPRVVVITVSRPARVPLFGEVLVRRAARAEFDPRLWLGRGDGG